MFSTPSAAYTAVAVLVLATCYSPVLATPGKAVTQLEGYTFERYVSEFGKDYGNNEEWEARREIFLKRLNAATVHNARAQQSYFRGINHLSDRTEEELKEIKGLDRSLLHFQVQTRLAGRQRDDVTTALDVSELPDSVDWRDRGIITPVKNQG